MHGWKVHGRKSSYLDSKFQPSMVEFGSQIEILDKSFFCFKFLEREYFRCVEFIFGIWKNELNGVNLGVKGLYRCPKHRQKYIAQGLINQEKTQISLKLPTTPPTDRGWINYPSFTLVVHGQNLFPGLTAVRSWCVIPPTVRRPHRGPWLG